MTPNAHPFWKWAWRLLWVILLAPCVCTLLAPLAFYIMTEGYTRY